jgi:DNA-directed RNA polymerase specialized sigma24 family protein/ribosome-associated translation inhibitor RaiA
MNVHISYKVHKTPDFEKEITHWASKLQKRLQVFRPELVHLKGIVEQNSPREGTTVSLNLRLPSGQMAVQESATPATAAIKTAFDDLLQQLNKHKELLRSSNKWRRRRVQAAKAEPQAAFEKTFAAVQPPAVSPEDIRSYVNANLGRLERYVERELYFREVGDQIPVDSVTKEEVIDETIARALGDGDRPERLALEPWLYRLAIRAIDELAAGNGDGAANIHLEESARKPNVRASDEAELQFHQPDETLTEESVIADRRTATPEDIAYSDEMITLVQFALAGSKRRDREAFILHAMEGFSVEEIAAITDRNSEEVRTSITAAREHVRRSPPLAHRFRDKLLQNTGVVGR